MRDGEQVTYLTGQRVTKGAQSRDVPEIRPRSGWPSLVRDLDAHGRGVRPTGRPARAGQGFLSRRSVVDGQALPAGLGPRSQPDADHASALVVALTDPVPRRAAVEGRDLQPRPPPARRAQPAMLQLSGHRDVRLPRL